MAWDDLKAIWRKQKADVQRGREEDQNICPIDGAAFKVNPRTGAKACDYGHSPGIL